MKALFLADLPSDGMITSGVQAAALSLCEGLSYFTDIHEIVVVSLSKKVFSNTTRVEKGIQYHFLPSVNKWYQKPTTLLNVSRVRKIIQHIRPDVINVIDNPTMAIAALHVPCPKLFTIHGIKTVEAQLWRGAEYWSHHYESLIEKYVHRHYQNIIAVSPYVVQLIKHKFADQKNVFLIPNAVSESFFNSEKYRDEVKAPVLLNIGSYTWLKSQHILVKAVVELQNEIPFKCVFCGPVDDPQYFMYLQSLIGNSHHVQFRQVMNREEIINLMGQCTMLVHTSRQENSPMIFLEAMAMKLPIASSRVGGVQYLLDNERFGTTYEYGNRAQLKEILRQCVTERSRFQEKADAAFDYVVRHHHPRNVAERTLETMSSLIQ